MKSNREPIGAITPNGFEFTISNDHVTGMDRLIGTHAFNLTIPANATFAVDATANTVTETLTGSNATEILTFAPDPTSANLYHLASETKTIANPTTTNPNGTVSGYSFTITGSTVTGVQGVWGDSSHTYTQNLPLLPTSIFSVDGGTVTETLVHGNAVETLQFVQSGSSGLYAVASKSTSFIQQGEATTPLSVDPFDRAKFTVDAASGAVTQVQHVRPDGSVTSITPNANTSFSQLETGYILETVTFGTHSAFELYHDGNGDGIYTAIAHGTGTTVDLVGVKSQMPTEINAVT